MPRYGFLLVTLMGENANFPEVCHGMRQLLTPASIALTIWDVTREYTSCFSGAVFSFVDIVKPPFAVFRNRQVFRPLAGSACIARLIQEFTPNKPLEVTCGYRKSTGGWVDSKQGWRGHKRGRRWVSVKSKKKLEKKLRNFVFARVAALLHSPLRFQCDFLVSLCGMLRHNGG